MHTTPHAAAAPPVPRTLPRGFRGATAKAGIRKGPGDDLALIVADAEATAAAVFTRNRFAAAPIVLGRRHLAASGGRGRAVLVNAGCANAATGAVGDADAQRTTRVLAEALGTTPERCLVNSTGVIGRRLPIDSMCEAIPGLVA